jgi:hypothetical protein
MKPGMAQELLQELGPLLTEDGIAVNNLARQGCLQVLQSSALALAATTGSWGQLGRETASALA